MLKINLDNFIMIYIIYNMVRPLRIQEKGATYHIFSRGNLKQEIFSDDKDKAHFLKLLQRGVKKYRISLFSYCLMSNHYHLLLRLSERNLSQFMHFLGTSYAIHLVRKGWVGHVFAGRFKSILVEEERYFLSVNRYIHLNPVEAGVVERPEEYPWSNYCHCIEGGNQEWLEEDWLTDHFGPDLDTARVQYRRFVEEAIGIGPCYPENEVVAQSLLGSEEFVRRIKARIKEGGYREGVLGCRTLTRVVSIEEVRNAVCEYLGITDIERGNYRGDERYRYACWLLIYIAKEHTAASNKDIAEILGGISINAVSRRFMTLRDAMRQNVGLQKRLKAGEQYILKRIGD